MTKLNHNVLVKMGLIVVIVLFLLIPSFMIGSLIYERENRQQESIQEVSGAWGAAQTLIGPVISVPYYRYINKDGDNEASGTEKVKEYVHFLPETLDIVATIVSEVLSRGIYDVVVYNSVINFSGTFKDMQFDTVGVSLKDVLMDQASVSVGITDVKGLEHQVNVVWNNKSIPFGSGLKTKDIMESGISTALGVSLDDTKYDFSFELRLKGSQQLYFVPIGKATNVTMNSTWNTPSFAGEFLPDTRTVDENGFSAYWNILQLNRNFPQAWVGTLHTSAIYDSAFGTQLLLPMDNYQKTTRSIKYAILFIVLTFLVCFFVEISNNVFIHPIQYILVGLALLVFYLLLLAISEYIGFNFAFVIAAIATLLLIAVHMYMVLRSLRLAILIIGILIVLYGFVFSIIQLQDYALLVGAIGLFIILAVVMYFARKIDWYAVTFEHKQ